MGNGREKFLESLSAAQRAIKLCMSEHLWLPALVLVYALIDAMAWIARDPAKEYVTQNDFVTWCNRYLLIPPMSDCSGEDLYAARCGILHSHIAESRLMREEKARPLSYQLPSGETLVPIHTASAMMGTIVQLESFIAALDLAAERFVETVDVDLALAKTVWERADKYYDKVIIRPPQS